MRTKDQLILENLYTENTRFNNFIRLIEEEEQCKVIEIFSLSPPNAKIDHWSFSLRSGWTCPFAKDCLAKVQVDPQTGKKTLERGKDHQFTCFSATQEVAFPSLYKQRESNEKLAMKVLKQGGEQAFVDTMIATFKTNAKEMAKKAEMVGEYPKILRIHVGGDFFNQQYYNAWCELAKALPQTLFYAYTKSVPFVLKNPPPENLIITNSLGGKYDKEVINKGLKFSAVIWRPEEVAQINPNDNEIKGWQYTFSDGTKSQPFDLPIDHDDSNAYLHNKPFALVVHGQQKAGSEAGEAIKDLKKRGVKFSYSAKDKEEQSQQSQ